MMRNASKVLLSSITPQPIVRCKKRDMLLLLEGGSQSWSTRGKKSVDRSFTIGDQTLVHPKDDTEEVA